MLCVGLSDLRQCANCCIVLFCPCLILFCIIFCLVFVFISCINLYCFLWNQYTDSKVAPCIFAFVALCLLICQVWSQWIVCQVWSVLCLINCTVICTSCSHLCQSKPIGGHWLIIKDAENWQIDQTWQSYKEFMTVKTTRLMHWWKHFVAGTFHKVWNTLFLTGYCMHLECSKYVSNM